jgi:hypothetical protein
MILRSSGTVNIKAFGNPTENLLSVPGLPLLMARISAIVRPHNRRAGGVHTYETSNEIAHCWQLLTREQQISLDDQAAKNHEDLPVLLERLFKERRL